MNCKNFDDGYIYTYISYTSGLTIHRVIFLPWIFYFDYDGSAIPELIHTFGHVRLLQWMHFVSNNSKMEKCFVLCFCRNILHNIFRLSMSLSVKFRGAKIRCFSTIQILCRPLSNTFLDYISCCCQFPFNLALIFMFKSFGWSFALFINFKSSKTISAM